MQPTGIEKQLLRSIETLPRVRKASIERERPVGNNIQCVTGDCHWNGDMEDE